MAALNEEAGNEPGFHSRFRYAAGFSVLALMLALAGLLLARPADSAAGASSDRRGQSPAATSSHLRTAAAPGLPGPNAAQPRRHSGHVTLPDEDDVTVRGGTPADRAALTEAITQLLESWCALDSASYRAWLTPEVTVIEESEGILHGPDAVLAAVARAWGRLDRPHGEIEADLEIDEMRLTFDGPYAFALSWVSMESRDDALWEGNSDDYMLFYQVFVRGSDNRYRLLLQAMASGLEEEGDAKSFDYEFAVPVADVARSVSFYTPLLGRPEHVGEDQAIYRVGAIRFRLDGRKLNGIARIRPNKPNGYAIFLVDSFARHPVTPTSRFTTPEGDSAAICLDPEGNPFVLLVENFFTTGAAPTFDLPPDLPGVAADAIRAWARNDMSAYASMFARNGIRFENTRSDLDVVATGSAAIRRRAAEQARRYDRSADGLAVRVAVREPSIVDAGDRRILTYRLVVEGAGPHRFRNECYVVQVMRNDRIEASFSVRSWPEAKVHAFDYVAYPAANLERAERFYRTTMRFGTPYQDGDWYGFWGVHEVFGIYKANRREDVFPEPGIANGYACFVVKSVTVIEPYLRSSGSRFPVAEPINYQPGINPYDGYNDLLATDPDGNLLLFTEYPER